MSRTLTRIVSWGHELLAEVVGPGDLAIDLTAGKGQDVCALFRMVGTTGQVVAFDIQAAALAATRERLEKAGAQIRSVDASGEVLLRMPGIDLVADSHARLADYLPAPARGIIANLGYLPGGNQAIITQPESTLAALAQAADLLTAGGRLVVAVYHGHPGGAEEAVAVADFFAGLPEDTFQVLQMKVTNRRQAPYLYAAERCA
ncbi:MAG: hypothetical protein C0622_08650 [Desulfuromonas sp.]|nr:MAG: hypothetical protein C0622_08650 [Desulfuromonas sp.]